MERKRFNGRFAPDPSEPGDADTAAQTQAKAQPPGRVRTHRVIAQARRSLMRAVPAVAHMLVQEAQAGSVAHMKLLMHLLGLEHGGLKPQEKKKEEKTLEQILLEGWEREP